MNYSEVNISTLKSAFGRLDAEFFRPDFLEVDHALAQIGFQKLNRVATKIDVGHVGSMTKEYREKGVLLLQTQNVSEFFIKLDNSIFITDEFHSKLKKSQIRKGDILIARSGSFGKACIYYEDEVINSADIIIVNVDQNKIEPEFLVAFLNSKYGSSQLIRFASGGVQGHVNLTILAHLKIPEIVHHNQQEIAELVKSAYQKQKLSKDLYTQATQLLEDALGLNNIEFKKEKSYTASFSEVVSNNRADADYYQTKYRLLAEHLETIQTIHLGLICNITKGFEVGSAAYTESGPLFIRVSNLNTEGFVHGNSDKYISQSLYNSLKSYQPIIGDILLTKDGTIGTCYVVDEEIEGIISSGILNLKVIESSIPKEYLALAINSKVCAMQASRDCSGALILHWKPEEIRKLRIPILSDQLMNQLAELASQSKTALKKSKELLEQAKEEVETLIEQAAQSA